MLWLVEVEVERSVGVAVGARAVVVADDEEEMVAAPAGDTASFLFDVARRW